MAIKQEWIKKQVNISLPSSLPSSCSPHPAPSHFSLRFLHRSRSGQGSYPEEYFRDREPSHQKSFRIPQSSFKLMRDYSLTNGSPVIRQRPISLQVLGFLLYFLYLRTEDSYSHISSTCSSVHSILKLWCNNILTPHYKEFVDCSDWAVEWTAPCYCSKITSVIFWLYK